MIFFHYIHPCLLSIIGPSPLRGSNGGSNGDGGNDGNSGTMVLHSTPQTPMTQMTQFQQSQKYEDPNVQYSLNGSITSPIVGNCSIVGSLRRNDTRLIDSSPHHHMSDINSIGSSSVNMCSNQQPCSPMISFKPTGGGINSSSNGNHTIQSVPGILASPLPQPPNNQCQQTNCYKSELTNSINITMNPVDGKCFDANPLIMVSTMQNPVSMPGCSTSSDGSRSAGDGGSESNYATVTDKSIPKNHILCDEDEEEEESHYSLIRKPDGQADQTTYNTLR